MSNRRRRPEYYNNRSLRGRVDISKAQDGSEIAEFDVLRTMWAIGSGRVMGDKAAVMAALVAVELSDSDPTLVAELLRRDGYDPLEAAETITPEMVIEVARDLVEAGFIGPEGPTLPG